WCNAHDQHQNRKYPCCILRRKQIPNDSFTGDHADTTPESHKDPYPDKDIDIGGKINGQGRGSKYDQAYYCGLFPPVPVRQWAKHQLSNANAQKIAGQGITYLIFIGPECQCYIVERRQIHVDAQRSNGCHRTQNQDKSKCTISFFFQWSVNLGMALSSSTGESLLTQAWGFFHPTGELASVILLSNY